MKTENEKIEPFTFRVPKPGTRDQYFGFTRSELILLFTTGKIKSYSMRKEGSSRGIRLIDYQSVKQYISTQNHETTATK